MDKIKTIIKHFIENPQDIIPAVIGNVKALFQTKETKEAIFATTQILSECPKGCSTQLECCGCSIYAAIEQDKKCKYSKKN